MENSERLETILVRYGLSLEQKLENEELDSFNFISLIIEIENEFNVSIPDEFLSINSFAIKRLLNYLDCVVS